MDEKALFTKFWTKESKTTRNVIARVPESSDYRPDPRSRTAMEIAWQIVGEEKMIIEALETGMVQWAPGPLPAEKWNGTINFFSQERPASEMAWSFLFDIVHHRGQITTYLRPMGSTVPQIYGPSADEP
jgi:uncharacterized damage-inducible protein DinB